MPAYKQKGSGSWYVMTQYTDWTGERKQKCKRGFNTRREALEWEQKFQQQSAGDLDMSFEAFVEIYTTDLKVRLKESTWQTKENILKTKILPYFGNRKINEITTKDVIAWQNELLAYRDEKHKPYSPSYLKTLHNQLSAIFNHAVRLCHPAFDLPTTRTALFPQPLITLDKILINNHRRAMLIRRIKAIRKTGGGYSLSKIVWITVSCNELE
jgi:integrase